jgi:radical SAM enzyme (TIGR01210 family)
LTEDRPVPSAPALATPEIRALREAKERPDPWARPPALLEEERLPDDGGVAPALTVFLTGAECPFTCVFCDLWRQTLDEPTPPGALVAQLEAVLADREAFPRLDLPATVVKLYNASNFFDDRAVPREDRRGLAGLLEGARRVVVECHPRLVGPSCHRFARALGGRLEVALGLETVHPEAFARLNKGMEPEDFERAAAGLRKHGVAVRAFVQVGLPWIPPRESVEWAVRSAAHALAAGACHVALIPTRGGNGAMELLAERGAFAPPVLEDLEEALARCLELPEARDGGAVVTADLWDLSAFVRCRACLPARRARLRRMSLSGRGEPPVACSACGADGGGGTRA